MPRVLGRDRNERVELDRTPYRGTFAGNQLKLFYPRTQMEFHVFKGRTSLYGGTRGMRMKKTLKTGRINWRFREVSS
jgi:hypothetical protein